MKVFAISDLHMSINNPKPMDIFGPVWDNYLDDIWADWRKKVTDDDVVIVAGDISWAMTLENAQADLKLLSENAGKKIIIRGNHDYWWSSISKLRSTLPQKMYAIQNDCLKFGDVIFCGTRGWMVPEGSGPMGPQNQKIFEREVIRLELTLKAAKEQQTNGEKIVCIMHYPPFNKRQDDSAFTKLLEDYGVHSVIYGHLHGAKYIKNPIKLVKSGIPYYLTSCDLLQNKLIEIEI
ncbi:MAG: metallophosphoesterase [Christensenellaceae bacterium]|nr:metallophosphoesterase [Christensenellaceae bacterium]